MGEWHEVKTVPYRSHPCHSCIIDYVSITRKTVDGKLYEKRDSCYDDCERLKKYQEEKLL